MHFTKFHGAGNDFIMIDSRKNVISDRSAKRISALCDRHFGIGADGLIILDESKEHDFKMSYYNSDGYPGTMCGNGGRCATAFAIEQNWIINNCRFEAADGLHSGRLHKDGTITISMNDVSKIQKIELDAAKSILLKDKSSVKNQAAIQNTQTGKLSDQAKMFDQASYMLDTGSPHLVIFVQELDSLDVYNLGKKFRYDERFIEGTNVNFVQQTELGIKVRTYERGVENETLSCGTGVTASAIASRINFKGIDTPVSVETLGGKLCVSFNRGSESNIISDITLTGPVQKVFEGKI